MLSLTAPPALREGDTIAVIAPAGPVPLARLAPGLRILREHFKLLVAQDIGRCEHFLAGSDARRAEEFNEALRAPQVRAIWAARGGYGCSRIVDDLDAAAFRSDPVPIIGFSDVTVLLCWAASLGFRSIHGPVLTQLGDLESEDINWTLDLLRGHGADTLLPCDGAPSTIDGTLVGGNLSLLAHLCGTSLALDFTDSLCVLEDVGERPYTLDRYLQQLLAQYGTKTLGSAAGVLLGDFVRCEEPEQSNQSCESFLRDRLASVSMPCGSGLAVGHGSRNRAFGFGGRARWDSSGLRFLDAATSR